MKRSLLSIAAVTLLSVQGFAQITITNTSFGTFAGTTDSLIRVDGSSFVGVVSGSLTGGNTEFQTFTTGPSTSRVNVRHIPQTGYDYADSMTENISISNDMINFEANILTDITAAGVIQYGERIARKAYFIPNGTPGTDSLVILAQDAMYYAPNFTQTLAPRTHIKLPLTNSTPTWNNNYMYYVKGVFTFTPDGYVDDTLERRRYVVDIQQGHGHTNLRIMKQVGGWSDYFNVIQVQGTSIQITDSFFINGVAATQAELDIFDLDQGQVTTYYRDYFFRAGEVVPMLTIHYTDGSRNSVVTGPPSARSLAHTQRLSPSSVNGVTLNNNYSIFPNPVKGGGTLNIDLKDNNANGKWSYNLINISGQEVAVGNLNLSGGKTNITLPNLPTGIYYIQATNGADKIVKAMEIE